MHFHHLLRAYIPFALLASSALGQRLWIVDANNGPGTDFIDLAPAIAAASPGDRVLIRAGSFQYPITIQKGITIMGDVNREAVLWPTLTIANIPVGQAFVLCQSYILSSPSSTPELVIKNCQGAVHLDSCRIQRYAISNCKLVTGVDCEGSTITVDNGELILNRANFQVYGYGPYPPALTARNAKVSIADSFIMGDSGTFVIQACYFPRHPNIAMSLDNSEVVFFGDSNVLAGGANGDWTHCWIEQADAIQSTNGSKITLTPGMRRFGAITGSYTLSTVPNPSLIAVWPLISTTMRVDVHGTPYSSIGLFASLPALPYATSFGTLYLDPVACWWLTNAVTDGLGFWGIDYTIPTSVPRGLSVLFQAAVVDSANVLRVTTPSVTALTMRSTR